MNDLNRLRHSRSASARDVQRAQVLWRYHSGENIATIMKAVGMTRKSVSKWIKKTLAMGVAAGIKDTRHGNKPTLTEEGKVWVVVHRWKKFETLSQTGPEAPLGLSLPDAQRFSDSVGIQSAWCFNHSESSASGRRRALRTSSFLRINLCSKNKKTALWRSILNEG